MYNHGKWPWKMHCAHFALLWQHCCDIVAILTAPNSSQQLQTQTSYGLWSSWARMEEEMARDAKSEPLPAWFDWTIHLIANPYNIYNYYQLLSVRKWSWLLFSPDVWRGDCERLWHTVPTNNFTWEEQTIDSSDLFFSPESTQSVSMSFANSQLGSVGRWLSHLTFQAWAAHRQTLNRHLEQENSYQGPLKSKSERLVQQDGSFWSDGASNS